MQQKTAILFFSRSAKLESQLKQIHQSRKRNALIVKKMYTESLAILQNADLPVICFDEQRQVGKHFGEKLANSILNVYKNGYEEVIVVGNDCPQLSANDLSKAQENLEAGYNTIGQTQSGGIYLLALHKADFDANSFATLPWQTNQLAQAIKSYLQTKREYQTLAAKREINSAEHLKRLSFLALINEFINQLLQLAKVHYILFFGQSTPVELRYNEIANHRGPPTS